MYLKRSRRRKGGEAYESWSLVESVRTALGPRQRTVATIGKLLEEMAEVRSLDVVRPTRGGAELRLRTVSRSKLHLAILLQRLGLPLPSCPKELKM